MKSLVGQYRRVITAFAEDEFIIEVLSYNPKGKNYTCLSIDDHEPWKFEEYFLLNHTVRDYTPEIRALFDVKEDNNE